MSRDEALLQPIIAGIHGLTINLFNRLLIEHPRIGGILLFGRNVDSKEQLTHLIDAIQKLRRKKGLPALLIAIDHAGGENRLLKTGVTSLPFSCQLGDLYDKSPPEALLAARALGRITAIELGQFGINMCLGPILDLANQKKQPRTPLRLFHKDPEIVGAMASEYVTALQQWGMIAVPKHFPGNWDISYDPHFYSGISHQTFTESLERDFSPYLKLCKQGLLHAMMLSHHIYLDIDDQPATGSLLWLQTVLRKNLRFSNLLISDCLQMVGAYPIGKDLHTRIIRCLTNGCDMVICGHPQFKRYSALGAALRDPRLLAWEKSSQGAISINRIRSLPTNLTASDYVDLKHSAIYQDAIWQLKELGLLNGKLSEEAPRKISIRSFVSKEKRAEISNFLYLHEKHLWVFFNIFHKIRLRIAKWKHARCIKQKG